MKAIYKIGATRLMRFITDGKPITEFYSQPLSVTVFFPTKKSFWTILGYRYSRTPDGCVIDYRSQGHQ